MSVNDSKVKSEYSENFLAEKSNFKVIVRQMSAAHNVYSVCTFQYGRRGGVWLFRPFGGERVRGEPA